MLMLMSPEDMVAVRRIKKLADEALRDLSLHSAPAGRIRERSSPRPSTGQPCGTAPAPPRGPRPQMCGPRDNSVGGLLRSAAHRGAEETMRTMRGLERCAGATRRLATAAPLKLPTMTSSEPRFAQHGSELARRHHIVRVRSTDVSTSHRRRRHAALEVA
uniref:hypothetical protein n=1 Tax=Sandaracinus sp. TaxID=2024858 RepID=UPI0019D4B70A|nr:hypothetical protein [Sandaracinus sp.]